MREVPASGAKPERAAAGAAPLLKTAGSVLPLVWQLVKPRRMRMLAGFVLLLASQAAGLLVPYAPKVVIDQVIGQKQHELLAPVFAVLALSVLFQAATSYALSQILSLEGQRLITEMRCRVHAHLTRQPIAFFDRQRTGELVSRVMSDVSGLRNLVGQGFIELAGSVVTAVFVAVILWRLDAMLTLVSFAFLAVLGGFLSWAFRTIRPLFRASGKIAAEVSGRLVECFSAMLLIKSFRAERRERRVFAAGADRMLANASRTITLGSAMRAVSILDVRLLSVVVLCFGAREVVNGHLSVGSLVSYLTYLSILVAPVTQVASVGTQLAEAFAGLDRTREILEEPAEDDDPARIVPLPDVQGRITFEDVAFSYEGGEPVLDGVDFEAMPGTVTALVGASGAGKSTITALAAGLYAPSRGVVRIDGVDMATVLLNSFRPALGVVPQESFLFDGSVRDNVIFTTQGVTREAFLEACRAAHVSEFVEKLEKRYDTPIGERGVRLSGGQRQRISIARAILSDPRILILDEATSSLDSESEALVQDGLRRLMRGRTTFVIAHRLSTAREADQILVVERGRIVERGSHDSLFALGGRYHAMYARQQGLGSDSFDTAPATATATRRRVRVPSTTPDVGESDLGDVGHLT